MFKTKYSELKLVPNTTGNGIGKVYDRKFDKYGKTIVYVKGTQDIYSQIQESSESVSISTIIKKFLKTGDQTILQQSPGFFADLTNVPETMADAMNQVNDVKNTFNKLPIEIQMKYNMDYRQFVADSKNPDFLKNLGYKDKNGDGKVDKNDIKEEKKGEDK